MTPKWQKLASLAQEICTLWFQFYGAVFASKGYPFKNILHLEKYLQITLLGVFSIQRVYDHSIKDFGIISIYPTIFMHSQQLTEVTSHKHLGLHISKDCTWHEQIEYIKEKAWL